MQETNELHSESGNPSLHNKLLNDVCNATKLLDLEDDGLAAEDEFDGIDPALKEKLDRYNYCLKCFLLVTVNSTLKAMWSQC